MKKSAELLAIFLTVAVWSTFVPKVVAGPSDPIPDQTSQIGINEALAQDPDTLKAIKAELKLQAPDDDPTTLSRTTWLYRNVPLFCRNKDGSFAASRRSGSQHRTLDEAPPSVFNGFIKSSLVDAIPELRACGRRLTQIECEDLLAVKNFNKSSAVLESWPWHGYTRTQINPKSTLDVSDERVWLVPDSVLTIDTKTNDFQVMNWILRYTPAIGTPLTNPLVLSVCLDPRWKEFAIRVFSPERGVNSQTMHVILSPPS
jgi:hypothetical protein